MLTIVGVTQPSLWWLSLSASDALKISKKGTYTRIPQIPGRSPDNKRFFLESGGNREWKRNLCLHPFLQAGHQQHHSSKHLKWNQKWNTGLDLLGVGTTPRLQITAQSSKTP